MSVAGWKQFTPFYLSAAIVLCLTALVGHDGLSWIEISIQLGVGLLLWMLIEYCLHRFVFHYEARTGLGRKFLYKVHLSHHENPSNTKILSSLLLAVAIAPGIFLVAWGATGAWRAAFYLLVGVAAGYFYYEWLHFYVHHARPQLRPLRYLRTYHLLHHHQTPEMRFGVTTPVLDLIFKTFRPIR
ncbi:MAG TPA: sterol desaturase family protein [Pyrinomonadaceae bacterium]